MQEILFFLVGWSLSIAGFYTTNKVIKIAIKNDQ